MCHHRQSGFSLLEVLVAFSILALALGVLLQSFSTGMRGVTQSGLYSRATLLAESIFARAGRDKGRRDRKDKSGDYQHHDQLQEGKSP